MIAPTYSRFKLSSLEDHVDRWGMLKRKWNYYYYLHITDAYLLIYKVDRQAGGDSVPWMNRSRFLGNCTRIL